MSGAKETPRQKMIGMMYLVLTALLALNVSVDVLNAFKTVNEGLENTYYSVDRKISDYYETFEQQYNKQPEKTAEVWKKAQEIRTKTDEIINFIEKDIKLALLLENQGGISEEELINPKSEDDVIILNPEQTDLTKNRRVFHKIDLNNIKGKDKHDCVANFMLTQDNATVLRNKIQEYRDYIINTVESTGVVKDYDDNVGLRTEDGLYFDEDGLPQKWQEHNFDHVIAPAAFSIINELVAEVQTTEYDAISELFKSIGASDFKFNRLEAKVFPKSTYVLQGQEYEADVFIVASDDTKEFDAKYAKGVKDFSKASASAIQKISSKNGVIKIKFPATASGEQNFAGVIEMKNPLTGEVEPYAFESSYTVAPPSANVTPTKMNVMYKELENPISVAAPGFTDEQIVVEVANGELVKRDGELFVLPGNDQTPITTVSVYANVDGKKTLLQHTDFRLKRVPDPIAVVNGKAQGKFSKDEIIATGGFRLDMGDFDFEGYNFEVISYRISSVVGGYEEGKDAKGRRFTDDIKKFISNARPGQKIRIEQIRVKSPGGEERLLNNSIVMEIK